MAGLSTRDYVKLSQDLVQNLNKLNDTTRIVASYGFNVSLKLNKSYNYMSDINATLEEFKSSLVIELKSALDSAMEADIWGGAEDADLVDTGNLRDSLDIQVTSDGIMIDYSADYAALIHYGGYILPYGNSNATRVYITGRPWVESVLFGTGPIAGYNFADLFNRVKGRIFG